MVVYEEMKVRREEGEGSGGERGGREGGEGLGGRVRGGGEAWGREDAGLCWGGRCHDILLTLYLVCALF